MRSSTARTATAVFLAMTTLAAASDTVRAAEKGAANASAPIVWTLDNVTSVGGQKPFVLGAPKLLDKAAGGPALQFNGQSDGLIFPLNPLAGWTKFTIEVLLRPAVDGPRAQRFLHIDDGHGSRALLETRTSDGKSWVLDAFLRCGKDHRTLRNRAKRHPAGKWAWVALVYDGNRMTDYVNGTRELSGRVVFPPMPTGYTSLGVRLNRVYWFNGSIKEVRFHPQALAPGALQRATE